MSGSRPWTNARLWFTALAVSLLALAQPAAAQERTCEVTAVTGQATLFHDNAPSDVAVGTALSARDRLTTGPAGRVEIVCSDQALVTVGPDTDISLGSLVGEQGGDTSIGMSLHRGIARFLAPVRTWGTFKVFGPVAVASVRSTEWIMLTPKAGTSVFVIAGVVDVQSKRGQSARLQPTEGIDVTADGTMQGAPKKWGASRVTDVMTRLGLQ
jgi:hypothetical protein